MTVQISSLKFHGLDLCYLFCPIWNKYQYGYVDVQN